MSLPISQRVIGRCHLEREVHYLRLSYSEDLKTRNNYSPDSLETLWQYLCRMWSQEVIVEMGRFWHKPAGKFMQQGTWGVTGMMVSCPIFYGKE
jgi:hypothetical protein